METLDLPNNELERAVKRQQRSGVPNPNMLEIVQERMPTNYTLLRHLSFLEVLQWRVWLQDHPYYESTACRTTPGIV